jgi:hypothetical protein
MSNFKEQLANIKKRQEEAENVKKLSQAEAHSKAQEKVEIARREKEQRERIIENEILPIFQTIQETYLEGKGKLKINEHDGAFISLIWGDQYEMGALAIWHELYVSAFKQKEKIVFRIRGINAEYVYGEEGWMTRLQNALLFAIENNRTYNERNNWPG